MTKKTFTLLTITFGFFFSLFLSVTFQHPLYISKSVLLLSCLGGFGTALLIYLLSIKKIHAKKLDAFKFKQLALLAFTLSLAYLILVGYTPNTLLMPAVKVQLTITPATSAAAPLTSLVAVSEGSGDHFFTLKAPEVTHSDNVVNQDRKLIIHADPSQPASITLQGKAWSERINFSFEESSRDFVVDFFVDGVKSTYSYTAGQGDAAFITSVPLPPAYANHILSFVSFFLSLFVSFFFLGLQGTLLRERYPMIDSSISKVVKKIRDISVQIFSFLHINEIVKTTQTKTTSENKRKTMLSVCLLIIWLMIVIFTVTRHEFRIAEVRAWSQAVSSNSLLELYDLTQYDGHPVLWFLILYIAKMFSASPLILPILSISIAFAAVAIFIFKAPFPLWFKCLFIFCGLPLYEYSVMARSYGLVMLLLFIAALAYRSRAKHPLHLAFVLFLLANTHVLSAILAVLIALLWAWDLVVEHRTASLKGLKFSQFLPFIIIFAGVLLSLVWTYPRPNSIISSLSNQSLSEVFTAFINALKTAVSSPGRTFSKMVPFPIPPYVLSGLIFFVFFGLVTKPNLALAAFSCQIAFAVFFHIVSQGVLRHQGFLLIFMLFLYWLFIDSMNVKFMKKNHQFLFVIGLYGAVLTLILGNIVIGYQLIRTDINEQTDSSKAFGEFLNNSKAYRDAIIVTEPDFTLESLPYYADNSIYYPREARFSKVVLWTTDARARLSLGELLSIASTLMESQNQPVLIVLGHLGVGYDQPGEIQYSYNKVFSWSRQEWEEFEKATSLVAEFTSAVEEKYRVYAIK